MGPEILSWAQLPTPEPGPGEVRSAIKAVSLNFPNLLIVQNKYQLKRPLSFMHEAEHAGVIDALGSEAKNLRIGLPMAAFAGTGGFATHACVDAALVLLLPEGMALDAAAVFMLTCGTTHHALLDRAASMPGEIVLVLGAAGGLDSSAIQIAKAVGARGKRRRFERRLVRVVSIYRCRCRYRPRQRERARTTEDVDRGPGAGVVVDPVGGEVAKLVLRSIAWRGRWRRALRKARCPPFPLSSSC